MEAAVEELWGKLLALHTENNTQQQQQQQPATGPEAVAAFRRHLASLRPDEATPSQLDLVLLDYGRLLRGAAVAAAAAAVAGAATRGGGGGGGTVENMSRSNGGVSREGGLQGSTDAGASHFPPHPTLGNRKEGRPKTISALLDHLQSEVSPVNHGGDQGRVPDTPLRYTCAHLAAAAAATLAAHTHAAAGRRHVSQHQHQQPQQHVSDMPHVSDMLRLSDVGALLGEYRQLVGGL